MGIHRVSIVVLAALLVGGGCSNTEGRKTSQPLAEGTGVGSGGAGANLGSDGEFVKDLAGKHLAQVELSRMALNRASSAEVKTFAQMMLDDPSGDTLKSVVSEPSFAWPTQLDDKQRESVDELSRKQGTDFDRQYVKTMIEGHQNLAAKLEARLDVKSLADWKTTAAGRTQGKMMPQPQDEMAGVKVLPNSSDNAFTMRVNKWAADTYPVVQKHLDTARALEQTIGKTSSD